MILFSIQDRDPCSQTIVVGDANGIGLGVVMKRNDLICLRIKNQTCKAVSG